MVREAEQAVNICQESAALDDFFDALFGATLGALLLMIRPSSPESEADVLHAGAVLLCL